MYRSYPADLPPQPEKASRLAQAGRLIVLSLLLSSSSSFAEVPLFTWTDATGQVHFGDKPPPDYTATPVEIRVNTYSAPVLSTHDNDEAIRKQDIVLYSTKRCGYCRKARAFFGSHNIAYKEYDVETSSRGRADYIKLAGRGVPIILVGQQRMNGYSEARLTNLLLDAGYDL